MKIIIAVIIAALLASGCSKDPSQKGTWTRVMTDTDGNKYIVQHYIGGTFTVQKIEDK